MNTNIVLYTVIGIFVIMVGVWLYSNSSNYRDTIKEFNLSITDYEYSPKSIDLNLNDEVVLNIKNNDNVVHGINFPLFNIAEFVQPGEIKTVSFVADKTGSAELFCSSDHGEKLLININE